MSEPIKAGDLVQVVGPQPCCGDVSEIGMIFRVGTPERGEGQCEFCGRSNNDHAFPRAGEDDWFHVSRLKRIPPPDELGIVDEKEEITA